MVKSNHRLPVWYVTFNSKGRPTHAYSFYYIKARTRERAIAIAFEEKRKRVPDWEEGSIVNCWRHDDRPDIEIDWS